MAEWITTTLEECTDILGDGLHGTPKYTENGEYAFVNGNNLVDGEILIKKETKRVDYSQYDKYKKPLTNRTILVSINGTLGNVGVYGSEKIILGKSACYFNVKESVDKDFIYYIVSSPTFKQYLESNATGTTIKNISLKQMREYTFELPEIGEQKRISSVLRKIDEKIKNNRAINNNLAEQSQAIFAEFMCKYPYVLSPLGDMAEIIDCLHSKKPEAVNDTAYQLLQLNNITDSGFLDLSSKYYISKSDYENWTRKCEIVEGDCVITNVGRIGAVSQAPNGTHAAMGRNMTCIRLRKDKPFYSYLITALLSPHIRREIMKNTDEGTIMGALNVKNIPLLLFPMFALPTMNALENLLSPIRKAIEQNYLSNQTLSLLRDALLPRLMSGELDVSDIEL